VRGAVGDRWRRGVVGLADGHGNTGRKRCSEHRGTQTERADRRLVRLSLSAESAAIQQCFSLTTNQRTVLSAIINQRNEQAKGRWTSDAYRSERREVFIRPHVVVVSLSFALRTLMCPLIASPYFAVPNCPYRARQQDMKAFLYNKII
jgi:hypothetical protein